MRVEKLRELLRPFDPDVEVEIVATGMESSDEYPVLKIWDHPETPDNDKLNPEIVVRI
jgi:hypothetical protein